MATPSVTPPTLIQPAIQSSDIPEDAAFVRAKPKTDMSAMVGQIAAAFLAIFWAGTAAAFFWGMYQDVWSASFSIRELAITLAVTLVPPCLFITIAWMLTRGYQMSINAELLADATDRLFSADETAGRTAARLGRVVRRELDALNAGLDGAFTRLRALESVLENQISALDEAGARVDVRGEALASRLTQERERIEGVAASLTDAATRAGETVAGRSAQLKSMIEAAETSLKAAGLTLDTQAASFRASAGAAAEAPHAAAVELDKQAKRIESVADSAMARAEFVLGRQERHRTAMNDLMQRLKEDSTAFEQALTAQRTTFEQSITAFTSETKKFENLTGDAEHNLELLMAGASMRTAQLANSFTKEADRLKDIGDAANNTIAHLIGALQEAGVGAQTLIGETAGQAKADAKALVGEAMAECERLLRTAAELSTEANDIRTALAGAVSEVEKHLLDLPKVAQQEAQRVRQMVRAETEEILDLSARTLSTIHARTASRSTPSETHRDEPAGASDHDGLRGLARKLTSRSPKKPEDTKGKWQMSALLAAVEDKDTHKDLRPAAAAALGALQAALNDMAIDLSAISADVQPQDDEWRRYLAGDRAVFARKLATTLDEDTVHRITTLYRDNARFRDSANVFMEEFEALHTRARQGDGGGLLAPTILSSDTGKIYLTIAYALGRL
jgi:hypothetical protein